MTIIYERLFKANLWTPNIYFAAMFVMGDCILDFCREWFCGLDVGLGVPVQKTMFYFVFYFLGTYTWLTYRKNQKEI